MTQLDLWNLHQPLVARCLVELELLVVCQFRLLVNRHVLEHRPGLGVVCSALDCVLIDDTQGLIVLADRLVVSSCRRPFRDRWWTRVGSGTMLVLRAW